jgi:hypothetical protein
LKVSEVMQAVKYELAETRVRQEVVLTLLVTGTIMCECQEDFVHFTDSSLYG